MSNREPCIADLRISFDLISAHGRACLLPDDAFRILTTLVAGISTSLVWTYSEPTDGSIPDDDEILARRAHTSKRRWRRVRPMIAEFFVIRGGRWYLNEEWIAVDDAPVRFAVPSAVQQQILTRQGKVCTYCGDTDGPFDLDHIFPVSRGGTNDASNLTLACSSCNRSKGARTLREWVGK
jgi:hypothetical protein